MMRLRFVGETEETTLAEFLRDNLADPDVVNITEEEIVAVAKLLPGERASLETCEIERLEDHPMAWKAKIEEAAAVVKKREEAFAAESLEEGKFIAKMIEEIRPILASLCSRTRHGAALQIAPCLFLLEDGDFIVESIHDASARSCPAEAVPSAYKRNASALVATQLGFAIDALIHGASKERTEQAERLAAKYKAIATLLERGPR